MPRNSNDRNILRRLERLEAHMGRVDSEPFSTTIRFLDQEKRVTSTLVMASGQCVWTDFKNGAGEQFECPPRGTREQLAISAEAPLLTATPRPCRNGR